jgi:hypothetical protein
MHLTGLLRADLRIPNLLSTAGPSFTSPPESPPNLPHLVHTYIYVYVDRFTDEPAAPHTHPRKAFSSQFHHATCGLGNRLGLFSMVVGGLKRVT